mmetsp:Transcript_18298/g.27803  ORF Transcript_18298/g.27803 Transcript_18298/m.27803 type:complete len:250 (+) Transcript_18298:307-1056(+)
MVKAYTSLRSIVIISNGKSTNTNTHLLTLENHGLILIIRNIDHEMSSGERKSRRPPRFQLGHDQIRRRHTFRLTHVPQMLPLGSTLVICIAHDRPGVSLGGSRLFVNGPDNICQVRCQNCHIIPCRFHLLNNVHIPILSKCHMCITLHVIVFTPILPMANMSRKHRPHCHGCIHAIDINLICIGTYILMWLRLACLLNGFIANIITVDNLIYHRHTYSFGMFRPAEYRSDGMFALPISVGCNGHEYGTF